MTTIPWTNATWNPIAAFDKATGKRGWMCVHAGVDCLHCYAEQMNQWRGNGLKYRVPSLEKIDFSLVNLRQPLSWQEPRMIFVCSMTDLFLETYPDEFIFAVFVMMAAAHWHTFQVLTKRAQRSRDFSEWLAGLPEPELAHRVAAVCGSLGLNEWTAADAFVRLKSGPLPNVWRGVSAGNQEYAAKRILPLLRTKAAVRFLSAEPLLGPMDLSDVGTDSDDYRFNALTGEESYPGSRRTGVLASIDWVIVGGESGGKARPCDVEWVRAMVDQCVDADVRVFVKQLGSRPLIDDCVLTLRNRKGEDPTEWPGYLRVREFPREVASV